MTVDRTYVPTLIKGGLGSWRWERGIRCLMKGSCKYCLWTADSLAIAASESVSRIEESGSASLASDVGGENI
jgi:hypothetical protein